MVNSCIQQTVTVCLKFRPLRLACEIILLKCKRFLPVINYSLNETRVCIKHYESGIGKVLIFKKN